MVQSVSSVETVSLYIQRYGDGRFSIANQYYAHSVLILPDEVQSWPVTATHAISPEALQPVMDIAKDIDILLIGSGLTLQFQPELIKHFRPHGVTVDVMDTGAACRTYNVLLSEGRRVAAALIAVE